MTNIFNFPPKKGETAEGDFLHDANELLQFDAAGRDVNLFKPDAAGAESTQQTPPLSKDWSNQELASIYRVKRLLDAAGVPNHIERSLSDEGDPWCVFCGAASEVFIHLCRIDGLYVLDSPNLAQPIYGRDFNDLIEKFSDGALRDSDKASKVRSRLIKLERGGKVFLHPAALLAALIWSIYLNSEDLVLFVPDGEDALSEDDAVDLVAGAVTPSDADDAALEAEFIDATALPDEVVSSQTLAQVNGLSGFEKAGTPFYKDLFGKAGLALAPSGMAIGLSTIAIAYGFISESYFEDDAEDLVALGLTKDGTIAAKLDDAESAENQTPATRSYDLVAALDAVFDQAGDTAQDEETVLLEGSAQIDISGLLDMTLTPPTVGSSGPDFVQPGTDGANAGPNNLVNPEQPLALEADPAVIITTSDAPDGADDVILADVVGPIAQDFFSIADLRDSLSSRLTEFFVGETRFEASFDIAELSVESSHIVGVNLADDDDTFVVTSSVSAAATVPIEEQVDYVPIEVFYAESDADVIDRKAYSFVNYLMSKNSDVQVIARDNEIVLIDFAAFGTSNDQAYSMSWNLEHGGTVQTIGLRSEFMEFDLIA